MPFNLTPETLRLAIFLSALFGLIILETLLPKKKRTQPRHTRWMTNFALTIINTVALKVLGPVIAIGVAAWAYSNGWGLLNLYGANLPLWLSIGIGLVILDLTIYAQHMATHKIPLLWRLHKVHHADRDIDVTTGFRFHPVEILLSMLYKGGIVLLLGPSVLTVLIFEITLNLCAMFNHANLKLPLWLDKTIRVFIVTPDMHRVHHSVRRNETDSNYGFSLSLWDRVFRTYNAQPKDGHDGMTIGLPNYQTEKPSHILWSLTLPFKG